MLNFQRRSARGIGRGKKKDNAGEYLDIELRFTIKKKSRYCDDGYTLTCSGRQDVYQRVRHEEALPPEMDKTFNPCEIGFTLTDFRLMGGSARLDKEISIVGRDEGDLFLCVNDNQTDNYYRWQKDGEFIYGGRNVNIYYPTSEGVYTCIETNKGKITNFGHVIYNE